MYIGYKYVPTNLKNNDFISTIGYLVGGIEPTIKGGPFGIKQVKRISGIDGTFSLKYLTIIFLGSAPSVLPPHSAFTR